MGLEPDIEPHGQHWLPTILPTPASQKRELELRDGAGLEEVEFEPRAPLEPVLGRAGVQELLGLIAGQGSHILPLWPNLPTSSSIHPVTCSCQCPKTHTQSTKQQTVLMPLQETLGLPR